MELVTHLLAQIEQVITLRESLLPFIGHIHDLLLESR
jgi:hypothetical protein